jgi:ABC-type Fe3+-siderophore transport system permease subunit
MAFAIFMAGDAGRAIRAGSGLVFLVAAAFGVGGAVAVALAILGLTLLAAASFNVCLIAPLIGAPFRGRDALSQRINTRP